MLADDLSLPFRARQLVCAMRGALAAAVETGDVTPRGEKFF